MIEIMLAILGVMIALLGLISAVVAAGIGVLGWFGFSTIRKEAKSSAVRAAEEAARLTARDVATSVADSVATAIAEKIAREVATAIAEKVAGDIRDREQASELSETQAELIISKPAPKPKARSGKMKATSDKGLGKD